MNKILMILVLVIFISSHSFSQIIFEDGYFINNSNEKVYCLIKNIDWNENPTEFEYMLSQNTNVIKESIENVKEFGVNGVSKHIRAIVKIDDSSDNLFNMTSDKNPNFKEKTIFLKVVIDGNVSLYQYKKEDLTRFFYSLNGTDINQLVYKRYLSENKIEQNNYFKQQIFNDLKCNSIELSSIENLRYTVSHLKKIFIKFNGCNNSNYINYGSNQKKDLFNLSIKPGINNSKLTISNDLLNIGNIEFNNTINIRIGFEAEFIFAFNKNKWGIILNPNFQNFKSEKTIKYESIEGKILYLIVNYKSLELPIGVRHYYFLNDNSKIFTDISYVLNFSKNSLINFKSADGSDYKTLEITPRANLALGLGYKYNNKYSLGIRYQTSRNILGNYRIWESNYTTTSLVFGYSLF